MLVVLDLGAHDALRALAGRPWTGRSVDIEVQGARRACGPMVGVSGGFATLVEVAICSALAVLVAAVLPVVAVLAVEVALVVFAPR